MCVPKFGRWGGRYNFEEVFSLKDQHRCQSFAAPPARERASSVLLCGILVTVLVASHGGYSGSLLCSTS
jgi:hypothetical protein